MNSIERVERRLEGKVVDKIPNLNIIMQFAAKYIDVPYGKYVTDYRYLVEGNIKCCQEFGIDMVSAISDPLREASGLGADVIIHEDDVPSCKVDLIHEYTDLDKLKVADPLQSERMLDRIKAIDMYNHSVKDEFPILGWVEAPFAEACDLRGMNQIMMDLYDEPDFVKELLDICLEQVSLFAEEQIKAGADFVGVGDAAASLIGPDIYKELVMDYQREIIKVVHQAGARAKLHICGDITSLLEYLPDTGADIIDLDWMVDFEKAVQIFDGRVSACGNFDPVAVLMQGSIEQIKRSTQECIEAGDEYTMISAGCEVPKDTPPENLLAVDEALKEVQII